MVRADLELRISKRLARHCGEPATWVYDYNSGVSTWTPRLFQILGLPLDSPPLPCGHLLARYSDDSRERLLAAVAAANVTGGTFCVDVEIRQATGLYIPVRLSGRVTVAHGQPAYSTGTMSLLRAQIAARGGA